MSSDASPCTQAPAFVLSSCVCTQRKVRWSFFLLVTTIALVAICLVLFLSAVHYVKMWVAEKQRLRADVKRLSRHASRVMRESHQRAQQEPIGLLSAVQEPISAQMGNMFGSTAAGAEATTTRSPRSVCVVHVAGPRPVFDPSAHVQQQQQQQQQQEHKSAFAERRLESGSATRARTSAVAACDPVVHEMLDMLESVRLGSDKRGFVFAFDSQGGVWAHGKTRHLARGATGRVPGFHSVCDVDFDTDDAHYDDDPHDVIGRSHRDAAGRGNPSNLVATFGQSGGSSGKRHRTIHGRRPKKHFGPLADMLGAARRGGGFVHFRWKRNALMMAYIHPVKGTDLAMGGAVPVPRKHHKWEMANAKVPAGAKRTDPARQRK